MLISFVFFQRAALLYPDEVSSLCQLTLTLNSCQIRKYAACPLAIIVLASVASADANHDIPAARISNAWRGLVHIPNKQLSVSHHYGDKLQAFFF